MRIFLLRHGATDWNLAGKCQGATDLELNDLGLKQAETAAIELNREKIDAIYSSNLRRALQTAGAVGRRHNLPVLIEENLRELDHGALEGLTVAEIQAALPDFIRDWRDRPADADIPGGEKLIDVDRRAWDAMCRIARRHRLEETLVIVSHNFPILAVLCRITETPLNQYRTYHLPPGGVVRLEYLHNETWRVIPENGKLPLREL